MVYKQVDDNNLSPALIITVLVSTVQYTSVSHCSLNFEAPRLGYGFLSISVLLHYLILVLENCKFGPWKSLNFVLWMCYEPCLTFCGPRVQFSGYFLSLLWLFTVWCHLLTVVILCHTHPNLYSFNRWCTALHKRKRTISWQKLNLTSSLWSKITSPSSLSQSECYINWNMCW